MGEVVHLRDDVRCFFEDYLMVFNDNDLCNGSFGIEINALDLDREFVAKILQSFLLACSRSNLNFSVSVERKFLAFSEFTATN
jgi:hypothetical protein